MKIAFCIKTFIKRICTYIPDSVYLRYLYLKRIKKILHLKNPITFNEKLQWLKLYDRKPEYTQMVDKYEVKKYIGDRIGATYTIPTLGVWDKYEDIDFDGLPEQFVLKCTHDSGGVVLCKNKSVFDYESAKYRLNRNMRKNFYWGSREWPYKNVPPRIIAEQYMVDESGYELKDYKIFCFNGRAEYVEVDFNRAVQHKLNTYDFDWNPLNFGDKSPNDYSVNIPKPAKLEEMRRIAEELSKNMRFLRVDFYSIHDEIYVGELTLYPGGGFIQFDPPEMDLYYGEKLNLEE